MNFYGNDLSALFVDLGKISMEDLEVGREFFELVESTRRAGENELLNASRQSCEYRIIRFEGIDRKVEERRWKR